jgi:hypothetical protein
MHALTMEALDHVTGGGKGGANITVAADKNYVGLEVSFGGYSVAVWVSGGSVCGSVTTTKGSHAGCTPS